MDFLNGFIEAGHERFRRTHTVLSDEALYLGKIGQSRSCKYEPHLG